MFLEKIQKNLKSEALTLSLIPFKILGAGPLYATILGIFVLFAQIDTQFFLLLSLVFMVFLIGTGKMFYAEPRPYMVSDVVQTVGDNTSGFGHPSGHSLQSSGFNTLLYLIFFYKPNNYSFKPSSLVSWLFFIVVVVLAPLVMGFSRLYVGVHGLD